MLFFIIKVSEEGRGGKDPTNTEGVLTFHVYPETFWEPLEVATNSSLLVEESTSIAITEYDLRVAVRAEMSPKDIIYMVKRPPRYGYLEIDPPMAVIEDNGAKDFSENVENFDQFTAASGVTVFDQEIINEGRLHYIQSISNQVSTKLFKFRYFNLCVKLCSHPVRGALEARGDPEEIQEVKIQNLLSLFY